MSREDECRRPADVPFLPAGPGMSITRTCDGCRARVSRMQGTSQPRRGPLRQFFCAACTSGRALREAA